MGRGRTYLAQSPCNRVFSAAPLKFSFDRRLHLMSSNSRLTALLAALALTAIAVFAVGCGSSSDHHRRIDRRRGRRSAHGRLRHPLSPVRARQTRPLHRLRHRTDGSDRRKDRPHAGIPGHLVRNHLPRRRAGQVRSRDIGGDDHRRTREGGRLLQPLLPLRTGDPGPGRQRHHRPQRPFRQDRRRPAGDDRAGTGQGKSQRRRTPPVPRRARRGQRAQSPEQSKP